MTSCANASPISPARGTQLFLVLMAFAGGILGLLIYFLAMRGMEVYPEFEKLTMVQGKVLWTRRGEYGIAFQLEGDPRSFRYATKSGEWYHVAAIIANRSGEPIRVLIDPDDEQHPSTGHPFFQVYQLSSGSEQIRTYAQIRIAWLEDYRWAYALVACMLLGSGVLLRCALQLKEADAATRNIPSGDP